MPHSPALRVDAVVVLMTVADRALKTLFTRRGGGWALPSDAIRADEPLRRAAERVTESHLGMRTDWLEQLYTYGNTIPPPGQQRVIEVAYYGLVPMNLAPAQLERTDVAWFTEAQQPPLPGEDGRIAFVARRRLRGKLAYTAVGFELLPDEFTLAELQGLYEVINGRSIDKRNFRRKVEQLGIVEPTGRHTRPPRGPSAELWRFRPEVFQEIAKGDILAF